MTALPRALPWAIRKPIETKLRARYPYLLESWKVEAIDAGFKQHSVRSSADLGGVWRVDGGYTLHALEAHELERACIVDLDFSPESKKRAERFPQLELINERFTEQPALDAVGDIDAVLLFDVLVHQAAPDWDQVLELWAQRSRILVIANPQWMSGDKTIRMPELGQEEFLRQVPSDDEQHSLHKRVFVEPDEPDIFGKRLYDSTAIWQWGITNGDLISKMKELGFELTWHKPFGQWAALPNYENHAFVFARAT